uniref:Uncharacterized protein n=1 Tax=Solanum tuberosum TaxID=4113 RepID=M1DVI3_SOLTU
MEKYTFKIGDQNSKRQFAEVHYTDSIASAVSPFGFGVCSCMFSELKLQMAIHQKRSAMLVDIAEWTWERYMFKFNQEV